MLIFAQGADYPIATFLSFAIVIVFAFAYHEFAHALAADQLGDTTPRSYGRMTLNPIPHLDRVGLILVLLFGFGWASTPINPYQLRGNRRTSHALVAVAGPAANLVMAAIFALPIRLGIVDITAPTGFLPSLYSFLAMGVFANLLLMAFNLLPIPPLDGFTILLGLLPAELALQMEPLRRYGFLILLLALFLLPRFGLDVFAWTIQPILFYGFAFLTGLPGLAVFF